MAAIAIPHPPVAPRRGLSTWQTWGIILLAPYVLVFLVFVLYPVTYGLWLARNPESYRTLFEDPVFFTTVLNTVFFLLVAVNLKFALALYLSGFFVHERRWIRWLSVIFIIPWAVPAIPTIFSIRFMLNPEWGLINSLIFDMTGRDGPNWLNDPTIALTLAILVHIWKSLPFWTEDPHRKIVHAQFSAGTVPFEFTKNWKFTILNNENVWAKAVNRVVVDKWTPEKAVDEMVARIKQVAG